MEYAAGISSPAGNASRVAAEAGDVEFDKRGKLDG